jgi:hypothetical protein
VGADWSHLTQDDDQFPAVVNAAFHKLRKISQLSEEILPAPEEPARCSKFQMMILAKIAGTVTTAEKYSL